MEHTLIQNALPERRETINLNGTFRAKYRVFAAFLICLALLLSAFALTSILGTERAKAFLNDLGGFWSSDQSGSPAPPSHNDTTTLPPTEPDPIPEGATVIQSSDLSALSLGRTYIHNETPYQPDVNALLSRTREKPSLTDGPLVLILHTHTSEGYLPSGTAYLTEAVGDVTYTDDPTMNVLSVGAELCRVLNEKGIGTIHCQTLHDTPSLGGSYDRSAETVKQYLKEYPTIQYVIDLHRDAVTDSDGALIRAVTEEGGESVAQVMAVVGTDANGTDFDHWEENLALALALRERLNADGAHICRPVSLRNASFHQELAHYSLLLEIGTSGCTPDEAKRAAQRVGDALVDLICEE